VHSPAHILCYGLLFGRARVRSYSPTDSKILEAPVITSPLKCEFAGVHNDNLAYVVEAH
jgi:hypothetical protein